MSENWCFKRHKESLVIVEGHGYPNQLHEFMIKSRIPIADVSKGMECDWEEVLVKDEMFYDFEGCEVGIGSILSKSIPEEVSEFLLFIERGFPVVKTPKSYFLENWYDFVSANGFLGIFCADITGEYFMEFTDDKTYTLYSNFGLLK